LRLDRWYCRRLAVFLVGDLVLALGVAGAARDREPEGAGPTLRYLGETVLRESAGENPFEGVRAFTFDAQGHIHFVKLPPGHSTHFHADPQGRIIGRNDCSSRLYDWTQAAYTTDPLIVVYDRKERVRGHETVKEYFWYDLRTQEKTPIPMPEEESVLSVDRFATGDCSLLTRREYTGSDALTRLSPSGDVTWRLDRTTAEGRAALGESPRQLAVTSRNKIVLLCGESLQILGPDGGLIRTIHPSVHGGTIEATSDGGFLLFHDERVDGYDEAGERVASWQPVYKDGLRFRMMGGVQVAPDGRLWTSDGMALLRLNEAGIVDRTIGGREREWATGDIAALDVDADGKMYVLPREGGAVYVFDRSGRRVLSMLVRGGEVLQTGQGASLSVTGDGEAWVRVEDPKHKSVTYVRFSPEGTQLETRRLSRVDAEGVPIAGSWVLQHPTEHRVGLLKNHGRVALAWADAEGSLVREIRQQPTGEVFNERTLTAVSLSGDVAVLTQSEAPTNQAVIALFTANGDPVGTVVLPSADVEYSGLAVSGRRAFAVAARSVVIVDLHQGSATRYDIPAPRSPGDSWSAFVAERLGELILLDRSHGSIHRYALPRAGMDPTSPSDTAPILACTLTLREPACSVGQFPRVRVEITNLTDGAIYLSKELEGSSRGLRFPECRFTINGQYPVYPRAVDGNVSRLKASNFVKVEARGRFSPLWLPNESGFSEPSLPRDVFTRPGEYRIRFIYSTDSTAVPDPVDPAIMLPLTEEEQVGYWGGLWDREGSEADRIRELLRRVPRTRVVSNEVVLRVVSE
jgi:hypothetical protein